MIIRVALAAVLAWPAGIGWAQTSGEMPLTICMQQNDPPLSSRVGDKPSGFDVALSRTIAQQLGRDLHVQWFVSRDDPDGDLFKDGHALLFDGRCDLLAEYPLTEAMLAPPRSPATRLPPFDGAKPDDRRRWVKIGPVAATRPYRLDTLTVVLAAREAGQKVRTLGDLVGMTVGVQTATMADAIAMQYESGRLSDHVIHLSDTRDLFDGLLSGKIAAALVDLRAFDAWRLRHDANGLVASNYQHSAGFNMGFVGVASNMALIEQVDGVLADLQAHDAIVPLATNAGLTLIPPRAPDVLPDVRPTALSGD